MAFGDLAAPGFVEVTDGDEFDLFERGVDAGMSLPEAPNADDCGFNFVDHKFYKGDFKF
jgi:hypothetical protein